MKNELFKQQLIYHTKLFQSDANYEKIKVLVTSIVDFIILLND